MPRMISLGEGGAIDADHIVLVTPFRSKPIRRLLAQTDPSKILNMTYGYPRESVLLLDNGFLVITNQKSAVLADRLQAQDVEGEPYGHVP